MVLTLNFFFEFRTMMNTAAPQAQALVRSDDGEDPEDPLKPYQTLNEDETDKFCRICLETDRPESMIAPCRCTGSSKWVHRECLNLWRTNEHDRAFSKCTECLFEYRLVKTTHNDPWNNRFKFILFVSRDVLLATLLVQACIVLAAGIIWLIDSNRTLIDALTGEEGCYAGGTSKTNFWCNHALSIYYLLGLFACLIIMGIVGSIVLCMNKCSMQASLAALRNDNTTTPTTYEESQYANRGVSSSVQQQSYAPYSLPNTAYSTPSYEHGRYRYYRHRRRSRCADTIDDCCLCYPRPYVHTGNGDCCWCCCCCCCEDGSSADCDGCSNNNNHDSGHILLVILLAVAIIMAVIGFVMGVILAVIAGQRIVQRHIFLLQKKRLADEFAVVDLAQEDIQGFVPSAPPQSLDVPYALPVTPTAPPDSLDDEDFRRLRKWGLMD